MVKRFEDCPDSMKGKLPEYLKRKLLKHPLEPSGVGENLGRNNLKLIEKVTKDLDSIVNEALSFKINGPSPKPASGS